jgi:hypothetical protein
MPASDTDLDKVRNEVSSSLWCICCRFADLRSLHNQLLVLLSMHACMHACIGLSRLLN